MGIICHGSYLALPPKAVRHLYSHKPEKALKGLEDIKNFLAREGLSLEEYIDEALKTHLMLHQDMVIHHIGRDIFYNGCKHDDNTKRHAVLCKFRPVSTTTLFRIKDVMSGVFAPRSIRPSASPFIEKQEKIALEIDSVKHPKSKESKPCDPAMVLVMKAMDLPSYMRRPFIEVAALLTVLRCGRKATSG